MYYKVMIVLLIVFVTSESKRSRNAKLFSFNTVDEDISIDLEFSIPFISIPVKKTMDTALGLSLFDLPTININPASLALGGAVVLGTTVLVPWLFKSYTIHHPHQKYSRLLDTAEFQTDAMVELASLMMVEIQRGSVRGCALKVACRTGQMAGSPDLMKMWNQFLNNRLVSSIINATSVEDAMLSGRHGRDCTSYTPCPLKDHHIPAIVNTIAMLAAKL